MTDNEMHHPGLSRCTLPRRLAAIAYDSLVVTGLLLIGSAVASPFDQGNHQALSDPLFTGYLLGIWFLYMALCWMNGGMTIGMRAWRLRIMPDTGTRISWKICFIRFLCAFASMAVLGAGLLWSLFDREKRCWHDIVSRSGLYLVAKD